MVLNDSWIRKPTDLAVSLGLRIDDRGQSRPIRGGRLRNYLKGAPVCGKTLPDRFEPSLSHSFEKFSLNCGQSSRLTLWILQLAQSCLLLDTV